MSISVNPIDSTYNVSAAAAHYARSAAVNNNYEQLLSIEDEILASDQTNTTNGVDDTTLNSADLLDLSPAALNILNGIDNTIPFTTPTATTSVTITATANETNLNATQQAQAAAIIAEFANQSATQNTFTEIENALIAAGINPQELSIQQLLGAYLYAYTPAFSFNGPLFTDTLGADLAEAA